MTSPSLFELPPTQIRNPRLSMEQKKITDVEICSLYYVLVRAHFLIR